MIFEIVIIKIIFDRNRKILKRLIIVEKNNTKLIFKKYIDLN